MNRTRATSKSSDDIINELFDSLNLPASEKAKLSGVKDFLDSKESHDLSDGECSSSECTDQEIDKLLEEITDVTDKNIKVEDTIAIKHKDKKKKKKKSKKSNSTKSKHKKRKKKSHKVKSFSDSESERESKRKKSISPVLTKVFTSDTARKKKHKKSYSRSRSRSTSKSYSSKKIKRSRSRSKSKLYLNSSSNKRSRSRSKSKSYLNSSSKYGDRSRSRSVSNSDSQKNKNKKAVKVSSRSVSRSPSPKYKKELKHKPGSPSKRGTKEPLDVLKTKLKSQEKNSLETKLKLVESTSESTEHIPSLKSEPVSDTPNNDTDKTVSKGSDTQTTTIPSADQNASTINNLTNIPQKANACDPSQEKLNEGKNKPIVIKSLKDSTVLQQAEETQNESKDGEIHSETKSVKTVTEESKLDDEENLPAAVKKAGKEGANNEKDKKFNSTKPIDRSRSRSRSLRRSSSKTRRFSRSRSRKRSRSASKSRMKKKRSRSTSRPREGKYRKRSRSRDKFRKRSRSHSRSRRSTSRNRYRSKRSRSRSGSRARQYNKNRRNKRSPARARRKSPDCVDSLRDKATRKRLLEVARKNAVYIMKNNCLPPCIEKESVRATGKTVEELTSFCRQLVSKEYSDGEMSDPSLSPDEQESFSSHRHHPFAVKDSKPIMMNIRNAPMLPIKTNAERLADTSKLREQFPVSSGSQHRTVESEWIPVEKDESKEKENVAVFPEARIHNIDITQLVSTRLSAMRRLQDNPTDRDAMKALTSAQKDMQNWALSKQVPGQFTGSTGAKILSAEELTSGYQAWARKDQFRATNPVTSQFGMKMLQKMGWNPGEGLGKNKEGQIEPLVLDVKMDKRGLTAQAEVTPRRAAIPLVKSLAGKHPVSALVEICLKRKYNPPEFEIVFDCGPDHKKNFLMKVHVNNQIYKSSVAASTKKIAKANAAAACLQALGLIPQVPSAPIKSKEMLHTTTQDSQAEDGTDEQQASQQPQEEGQAEAVQGDQDPMGQYAVDGSQAPRASIIQYDADGNLVISQYNADDNPVITQYDAAGNPATTQYDADGNQVTAQYNADGNQGVTQFGGEASQTMPQCATDKPNNMPQYPADGSHVAQYGDSGTHTATKCDTDGGTDTSQYSANNAESVAQYGTNGADTLPQYSTSDHGMTGYQTDSTQGTFANYNSNSQAYQNFSAENLQAYQQQQQQQQAQQQPHFNANSQPGSLTFPQPPPSLPHDISGNDANAASGGSSDDSTSNHKGKDATPNPYGSSNPYANKLSYNPMQFFYGGTYQGPQY